MDIFSPRIGPFRSPSPPRTMEVVEIPHTNIPTIYCVVLATMPLTLVPAIMILPNPYRVTNAWKIIRMSFRRCFSWFFGSPSRPLSPPDNDDVMSTVIGDVISLDENKELSNEPSQKTLRVPRKTGVKAEPKRKRLKGTLALVAREGAGEGKATPAETRLPTPEPVMVQTLMEQEAPRSGMRSSQEIFELASPTSYQTTTNANTSQRHSVNSNPKTSRPSSLVYSPRLRVSPSNVSCHKGRSRSNQESRPRWRP